MKIILDSRKSLHANAAGYFEKSKQLREKLGRVRKAIAEVEERVALLDKKQALQASEALEKIVVKKPGKREWFEKFHWFFTSGGQLCVAGRDAKQNELLVAKHFDDADLFFHADVQGAAATILKNGAKGVVEGGVEAAADGAGDSEQELREAAQFAACFSRAWKAGFSSVDVYAVRRGQVSKGAQSGEYVGKGGFVMRGERKWFKNTELKLAVGKNSAGKIVVAPALATASASGFVEVVPGSEKKVAAKEVGGRLGFGRQEIEVLMALLP